MGRLTLNVLLSFAQFEREVTSERIRDKVAASKRKGMWMGGPVPLGYRLENRKLLIDESEAETVRLIFRRYLEVRSMGALADEFAAADVRSKVRQYSNGRTVGGVHFTAGSLAQLLKNPLFVGKVKHRGELFAGEHEAIIEVDVWDQVQSTIATNTRERRLGLRDRSPSLLRGMISDPDGRPMTPTSTTKANRQHRYYVTCLKPGEDRKSAWRIPAGDVDRAVVRCVAEWIAKAHGDERRGSDQATNAALLDGSVPEQRRILLEKEVRVQLAESELRVNIKGIEQNVHVPAQLLKRGNELRLVVGSNGSAMQNPDPVLLKLLAHAFLVQEMLLTGRSDPLVANYSKAHQARLLKLSWLAPDVIASISEGRQPLTLSGRRLLRAPDMPLDWSGQRRLLGFS